MKDYNDLLKALDDICRKMKQTEGLTTRELCDLWQLGEKSVRERLRKAVNKGLIGVAKKYIRRIDGQPLLVTSYYLIKNKKNEKERRQA